MASVYSRRRKSDMGLKKFLSRIVGYTSESQDAPHTGGRPGEMVLSNQTSKTAEIPKVVQEEPRKFDPILRSPSNENIAPTLIEAPKVKEIPKVAMETKPAEVAPQPVAEPVKVSGPKPRGSSRPRTSGERTAPRSKVNGTKPVNSAGASPKPRRTRKTAPKDSMAVASMEPRQTVTELGAKEKEKEKEKMAAPVLQGA
jgi:hypothetical protein